MTKKISKQKKLDKILRHHTYASTGAGLIPVPAADIAGLIAIQLNMIREITEIYEVPFLKEAAKKMLTSLIGAFLLTNTAPFLGSIIKIIPVVGQTLGMATMPIIYGASTYATGKVLIRHFDSGGTFLTFDPDKVKAYYTEMLKEGKNIAKDQHQKNFPH